MKSHKHAWLIKKWADGAKIEFWSDYTNRWEEDIAPCWVESLEYRIKSEPKQDKVCYTTIKLDFYLTVDSTSEDNLKLIFDGETGKLKSAEVLK
jgi:hypothetical protein